MPLSRSPRPSSTRHTQAVLLALLSSSALVRCDCEEVQQFAPAAEYTPMPALDFGLVPVTGEKTLSITVLSAGSAGLKLSGYTFPGAAAGDLARFAFEGKHCAPDATCTELKSELVSGLGPGRTSSITVTFRPCPDAWTGDVLKQGEALSTALAACATAPVQVTMQIADNTQGGGQAIILSGRPAQSPVMEVFCAQGSACNDENPTFGACTRLSFGTVAGGAPCDLLVELRNQIRSGKPTGELSVERIDLRVVELNQTPPGILDGAESGFSLRNPDGTPLVIDAAQRLVVPAPGGPGQPGTRRFKVRCDGTKNGLWNGGEGTQIGGQPVEGTGLRIYSDDPDQQPAKTVGLTAFVTAPAITVFPEALDFGDVGQGTTATKSLVVRNSGSVDLTVSALTFEVDQTGQKLSATTNRGSPPITLGVNDTFTIEVRYTPGTAARDTDALLIASNDLARNPLRVPISGGAVPRVEFDPSDTLVFAVPNPRPPPPIPERCSTLTIRNVGYGGLDVQKMTIAGPGGDPSHTSVDDFRIEGCASAAPCVPQPAILLCAPSSPGCAASSTQVRVCYLNNDNSTTDLAELKVETSDPGDPSHTIVLSAEDVPCFFPSPVITVSTPEPTQGSQVCVSGSGSDPGGVSGTPATITSFEWSWAFARSAPPPAFTPASGADVCFTPTSAGVHILNLHVTNSCGSRSQSPGAETIAVRQP